MNDTGTGQTPPFATGMAKLDYEADFETTNSSEEDLEHDQLRQQEDDLAITQRVFNDIKWSRESFDIYFRKCEDYYKQYRSFISVSDETRESGRSNVFVPMTFSFVENFMARLIDAFLSQDPYVKIQPDQVDPSAAVQLAAKFAEVRLFNQMDRPDFFRATSSLFKAATIFGTAYAKNYWATRNRTRIKRQRIQGAAGVTYGPASAVEELLYDGPEMCAYIPGQIFEDPTAGVNLNNGAFVIEETFKPKSYVEALMKRGVYKQMDIGSPQDIVRFPSIYMLSLIGKAAEALPPSHRNMVQIWEAWYKDGWVYTIANKNFVLCRRKWPFLHGKFPYVKLPFIQIMNEPMGVGVPELLEGIQAEINTTRNQRIDNVSFSINKIIKYRKHAFADPRNQLRNAPGAMWECARMDDVDFVRMPPTDMSGIQTEDQLKQDAQNVTGINDYQMGNMNSKMNDSARGVTIIAEQAASRIKDAIMNFGVCFTEIAEQWNALDAQFMQAPAMYKTAGDPMIAGGQETLIEVTPEDIAQGFLFNVKHSIAAINKEAENTKKGTVYAELKQSQYVDQLGLIKWFCNFMGAPELKVFVNQQPVAPGGGQEQLPGPPPEGGEALATVGEEQAGGATTTQGTPLEDSAGRSMPEMPSIGSMISAG